MKITELTEDIETVAESIDAELRAMVHRHVSCPINDLTSRIAVKLKAWALAIYHSLDKGAETNAVSFKTLNAIINNPSRFATQLIAHEISKRTVKMEIK